MHASVCEKIGAREFISDEGLYGTCMFTFSGVCQLLPKLILIIMGFCVGGNLIKSNLWYHCHYHSTYI